MDLKTPNPLQSEHQELLADLKQASKLDGKTGGAARLAARLLDSHFAKEDEFVLPPLGLLPALAQGTLEPEMAAAINMAARLHDELPNLRAEQRTIFAALEELMAAAEAEGHAELVGLAEQLMLNEEIKQQVSYPTAILIGKYLQLRLKT